MLTGVAATDLRALQPVVTLLQARDWFQRDIQIRVPLGTVRRLA